MKIRLGVPISSGGRTALWAGLIDVVVFCVRPLLRVQLALYEQDVSSAPFAENDLEFVIAGPDPDCLLFIGDVAVTGYGVFDHRVTVVFRTFQFFAKERGRGCRWATIGATDLTVARVARIPELGIADVDVVIIMLGVPHVLLGTSSSRWGTNLGTVINRIHDQSAAGCHIVLAGIPPMGDFRPMPPWVRELLMLQIHRLNGITLAATSHMPDTPFAPFPDRRVGNDEGTG